MIHDSGDEMAGPKKTRLPYEVTRKGLAAVCIAFIASLCLFWYGAESIKFPVMRAMAIELPAHTADSPFWPILAGASLMGGAIGAVAGQWFRDERGGAALMGAFIGALAGPPVLLILFIALLVAIWVWLGCPEA